jgi:propanol-preferring alcohol dehydrogenase
MSHDVRSQQMWAYRLMEPGGVAGWHRVPVPSVGPGQLLVRVSAAGLCHSDLTVMDLPPERMHLPLPMTLGHECAGTVARVGDDVDPAWLGAAVAVFGPWGCGECRACREGEENYCARSGTLYSSGADVVRPPGGGVDGALAEYLLVPHARHLVTAEGLAAHVAAPLTDAGTTAYHAVNRVRSALDGDSVVVVIGLGGLGHLAVQVLRALSSATIVAVDTNPHVVTRAQVWGAHHATDDAHEAVRLVAELTGGEGAAAVVDFVCASASRDLTLAVAGRRAHVALVGLGGADLGMGFVSVPSGLTATVTRWGSVADLAGVMELVRVGAVRPHVSTVSPVEVDEAYRRLRDGQVEGRTVVLMSDVAGLELGAVAE